MSISKASEKDIPELVVLINSAYRGEVSKNGWTTEAGIIGGKYRILESQMKDLMKRAGVMFLKFMNDRGVAEGSVFLEKRGEQLYLGMLSVSPGLQGKGVGHKLMLAAEDYAKSIGCTSVIMRVIHLRNELIEWYEKRGYYDTGRIEHFTPSADEEILIPFHFIVMQKDL